MVLKNWNYTVIYFQAGYYIHMQHIGWDHMLFEKDRIRYSLCHGLNILPWDGIKYRTVYFPDSEIPGPHTSKDRILCFLRPYILPIAMKKTENIRVWSCLYCLHRNGIESIWRDPFVGTWNVQRLNWNWIMGLVILLIFQKFVITLWIFWDCFMGTPF